MNVARDTKYAPGHIIKTRVRFFGEYWHGTFWQRSAISSETPAQARHIVSMSHPNMRISEVRVVKVTITEEVIK